MQRGHKLPRAAVLGHMLKGLYPQLVQRVIKKPTLKAGLSRSTQLPRRIYFNGQKNGGFQPCCLIQYEKISCFHASTACYSSLGQLLAPELSAPWFRGSSIQHRQQQHEKQPGGLRLPSFSGGNDFSLQQKKTREDSCQHRCCAEILEGLSRLLLPAAGPSSRNLGPEVSAILQRECLEK